MPRFVRYLDAVTSIDEAPRTASAPAVTVPPATRTEDLVTALCATAMMLGVLSDSWAHNNLLAQVQREGFLTPWHGLLYAGFAATGLWTFRLAYKRRDVAPEWWRDGWPAGYKAGGIGAVIFLLAGGADAAWHTLLGIEANIAALLSPSHLLLLIGSVLLLTSPTRSWWANGGGRDRAVSGVLALMLATVSVSIFVTYVSAFSPAIALQPYRRGPAGTEDFTLAARGLAAYLVTTALLVLPLLLVLRRRSAVPGTATALTAGVGLFVMISQEFPGTQTVAMVATIVAAGVVDGLLYWLDRRRGVDAPLRLPVAGALFAVVAWSAHLLALQLASGVHWPPELWSGTIVSTAGVGALLGGLAARPAPEATLART